MLSLTLDSVRLQGVSRCYIMSALQNKPTLGQFIADVPRFTSGHACTLLLLTLLAKTPPDSDWIGALVSELAQIVGCTDESIERELKFLQEHQIAEVRLASELGITAVRLRWEEWEALPDYDGEKL